MPMFFIGFATTIFARELFRDAKAHSVGKRRAYTLAIGLYGLGAYCGASGLQQIFGPLVLN